MEIFNDVCLKESKFMDDLLSKGVDEILASPVELKVSEIKSEHILKFLTKFSSQVAPRNDSQDNKCLFLSPLPLYNNGNNCYINSSIQSLLPTINKELFVALRNARKVNTPAIELFNAYIDQLERRAIGWSVINNIQNIKYFSQNFRNGAQEDAQEFLNGFLDRLRYEFDKIDRFRGSSNPIRKAYAPSYDSRYYCTKCNKSNMTTPTVQEELTFFLELAESLPSMLNTALRTHSNNYTCEYCKTSNGSARMSGVFTSLPRTFICCVKRFKHNLFNGSKIHREIPFSKNIHLPYVDSQNRRHIANYELSSIVIHLGNSINSGHYECVSKIGGQWYRISDSQVELINELQAQMSAKHSSYIYAFTKSQNVVKPIKRKLQQSDINDCQGRFKRENNNGSQPSCSWNSITGIKIPQNNSRSMEIVSFSSF